ncbi:MAG TPA: HAD-IIA family hydrolase [Pseudonocardiaceae bacterium]|nr:HAD-IIA family hydrolase [Pseudonocardiaceae bacterium]
MSEPLLAGYDALLLDLDGTVYRGAEIVDGAAEAVAAAHQAGVAVRYVTNNASRGPEAVAEQLTGLGIPAKPDEVTTSAQAAVGVLADRLAPGSTVLVVGADSLADEVTNRGLVPVRTAGPEVVAVVQGLSRDVGWHELAEATVAIRAGALWVASNMDRTLPTERGLLPGNGALVAAVRAATDVEPLVAGKPARPLMDDSIAASDSRHPLVVGDRLDTDIAGANAVGVDSLLVLSGVATPADLLAADETHRPTYLAADLSGALHPADTQRFTESPDWSVHVVDGTLRLTATDPAADGPASATSGSALTALRALCAAWWPQGTGPVGVRAEGPAAEAAVSKLGLASETSG